MSSPTPKPTEIPRPALVTDFPTYGGHTNYETFAPDGTLPIGLRMGGGTLGERPAELYFIQNEQMFDAVVTGKIYDGTGVRYSTGKVYLFRVLDSFYTGNIVDGQREFIVRILTDNNITGRLRMANNAVLSNMTWAARFYQVPGALADPGLLRSGLKDAAGFSNTTLIESALQGHNPGDVVDIDATHHPNDANYALIVFSKQ